MQRIVSQSQLHCIIARRRWQLQPRVCISNLPTSSFKKWGINVGCNPKNSHVIRKIRVDAWDFCCFLPNNPQTHLRKLKYTHIDFLKDGNGQSQRTKMNLLLGGICVPYNQLTLRKMRAWCTAPWPIKRSATLLGVQIH